MFYFRCNSILANKNTVYNVDCRYDEDLTGVTFESLPRTEDATMPCFKVLGKDQGYYAGVSPNSDSDRFQKYSDPKI